MLDKEFDQNVWERLDDHPSAVPDDMWQRIMRKEKDRKALIFWLRYMVGPAFIMACLMIGYWGSKNRKAGQQPITDGAAVNVAAKGKKASRAEKVIVVNPSEKDIVVNPSEKDITVKTSEKDITVNPSEKDITVNSAEKVNTVKNGEKKIAAHHSGKAIAANHASDEIALSPIRKGTTYQRNHLPTLANLKNRQSPKSPPLVVQNKIDDKQPTTDKRVQLDLSLSPVNPFTSLSEGFSYAAGLRVGVPIANGFSVITGLQFSSIGLKHYKDSLASVSPNHFTTLDLPLLIGYTTAIGNLNLSVKAGLMANLRSRLEGGRGIILSGLGDHTGLSLYSGLDLTQKLNSRIALFVEPWFRYQLSGNKGFGVGKAQTANTGGISVGLKYTFRKAGQRK